MYLEIYLEAYTWNLSNSNITSDYVFTAIAIFLFQCSCGICCQFRKWKVYTK